MLLHLSCVNFQDVHDRAIGFSLEMLVHEAWQLKHGRDFSEVKLKRRNPTSPIIFSRPPSRPENEILKINRQAYLV